MVQGVEVFQGRPIVYGAGSFVDDYKSDPEYRNEVGAMWSCQLEVEASGAAGEGGRLKVKRWVASWWHGCS